MVSKETEDWKVEKLKEKRKKKKKKRLKDRITGERHREKRGTKV